MKHCKVQRKSKKYRLFLDEAYREEVDALFDRTAKTSNARRRPSRMKLILKLEYYHNATYDGKLLKIPKVPREGVRATEYFNSHV